MKKFNLLMKTLLMAVGLCMGTSVTWATEIVLSPTGGVTTVNTGSTTVAYNSEATTWAINQGSLSGGNIGKDAGPYCLVKFDASDIPGTITEAVLSFDCTAGAYNSSLNLYQLGAADWDATTVIWSTLSASAKSATLIGSGKWGTKNTTVNIAYTITDKVSKSLMGFAISCNTAREQTISNIKLTINYTTATVYTATFTETNSLNPTVTIYSDAGRTSEVVNGTLTDETTYYYRAVLAGYNNYEGSFTVDGTDPSESFTMTAKPRYTFKVNLVNNDGGAVIQNLYTDDDSYDGKTQNVSYPLYLTGEGNAVTYASTDGSYNKSFTSSSADATKTIPFTAYTGEAYFFEGEDVEGATTYTTNTFRPRSSNGATGVLSAATVTSLEAGAYKITARSIGKAGGTHSIYKTSTEGEKIFDIATSTTGNVKSAIIILDATTDIVANGGYYTTSDNGHGFDYILIEKDPTITATITAAGWATLYTPYPLDFSGVAGLTAYTATYDGEKVTLKEVNDVPANTGVVLEGAANTSYNIPVIASPENEDKGDLKGNATDATAYNAISGYDLYMLAQNGAGNVQFTKVTDGSIAAGKAFLQVAATPTPAPFFDVVFDNGVTGIDAVKNNAAADGQFYNLKGQRISKPTKGLYIVNGKKVVIK